MPCLRRLAQLRDLERRFALTFLNSHVVAPCLPIYDLQCSKEAYNLVPTATLYSLCTIPSVQPPPRPESHLIYSKDEPSTYHSEHNTSVSSCDAFPSTSAARNRRLVHEAPDDLLHRTSYLLLPAWLIDRAASSLPLRVDVHQVSV